MPIKASIPQNISSDIDDGAKITCSCANWEHMQENIVVLLIPYF